MAQRQGSMFIKKSKDTIAMLLDILVVPVGVKLSTGTLRMLKQIASLALSMILGRTENGVEEDILVLFGYI